MKIIAFVALLLAAFWVWHHHTSTPTKDCLTAPVQVCADLPTTTRRH